MSQEEIYDDKELEWEMVDDEDDIEGTLHSTENS